ncbi:MAG: glycosyltransferase family 1 protein [Planctomycetota bacterium]|nr:glycosyltransferase family 1 protein [Planctomycetota bacterium]
MHQAPFYSKGFVRRVLIALDAALHQGDLNHLTGDINFASLLLARKKTLLTILDAGVLKEKKGVRKSLLEWLWFRLPAKHAKAITTISESAKRDILRHVDLPAHKIRVIPVAVSPQFQFKARAFDHRCPRILQVGTKQNKNLARLIPALAGLPCRLQIIGHLSDNMIKQLAQFKITYDNWSNLSLTEVVKKYEQCDLLAFCSTYEGFGMPIVEANAVGRAVVTSNCTSMPEVAGEAACLVNPNSIASIRDGIQKVINDDGFRNKIITQGISNAKRFDPEVIAKQYLSLYEEIAMNR